MTAIDSGWGREVELIDDSLLWPWRGAKILLHLHNTKRKIVMIGAAQLGTKSLSEKLPRVP